MTGIKGYFFAICILGIFVLIGKLLRVKVKIFQKLFLPSSIIAGFVALFLGPYMFGAVLHKNYINNAPTSFRQADVKDARKLAMTLRDQPDFLSMYLFKECDPQTQALLEAYKDSKLKKGEKTPIQPSQDLISGMVSMLNKTIQSGPIYDKKRFSGVRLQKEVNKYLGKEDLTGDQQIRVNRWLLEDAFPDALKGRFVLIPGWILGMWKGFPGVLINVVFASLFLGVKIPNAKKMWTYGGPQLCFGTVVGMGQYFIALLVTGAILVPLFKVPEIFGCIVEIGFSGGHGTAAGMTETFNDLGFPAGGALGQMSATVGIISAVVIGIILINIAIRKGYCACLNEEKGIPTYKKTGLIPEPSRFSIATATVATEAIEPLTFHFAIIAIAIIIGHVMLIGVKMIHPALKSFPLFPLAMIGGMIVQVISSAFKIDQYYDRDTFDRILGFSLDILVVSAIASIQLDLFLANLAPFLIVMLTGILWVVFAVMYIGPRMFPKYWFERSITEYGMQTGVTAIGLLLLRIVDPLYKTDTATSFGFKQMIYEPFLGGGLITATAPILVTSLGLWPSVGISLGIMAVFFAIAMFNGWVNMSPTLKYVEDK